MAMKLRLYRFYVNDAKKEETISYLRDGGILDYKLDPCDFYRKCVLGLTAYKPRRVCVRVYDDPNLFVLLNGGSL